MSQLRVVAVALRLPEGLILSLKAPARHNDILSASWGYEDLRKALANADQGFLLSDGKFATRIQARRIAVEADQIIKGPSNRYELYSEDVW